MLTAGVTLTGPGVGSAHAQECPDIEVVFARGTDDTPGLGRVGSAFVDSLRGLGANDASAHIQYMVANCPTTRLVLGGYSQGAAVIDIIAAVPFPAVGFNSPLPPNVPEHVAAIAVLGNPSTKLGAPLTISPVWLARDRPLQRR